MPFNYIEVLINIMLATFGGLVKRMTALEKDPARKVSLSYFIVGAFTSTFVGIVVMGGLGRPFGQIPHRSPTA